MPAATRRGARPVLTFDRGTLILHPPPSSAAWAGVAVWDDRIERLRAPASSYRPLVEGLARDGVEVEDKAAGWSRLTLGAQLPPPYPHQTAALNAWGAAGRRGVVVLPTGAGKTYVALMAMRLTGRSTLVCVPTLDLMHQWYAALLAAFPGAAVGLLGGGSRELTDLVVATYDSAVRTVEAHGNRWGLLVCDECHHLPGDLYRTIAEYSPAPYRLGLTATPERGDGRHHDLDDLLGPVVYRATPADLAGGALAEHEVRRVAVALEPAERERYEAALRTRDAFLRSSGISLGSLSGWERFVRASAGSRAGRRAMLAHREARRLALATEAKVRALDGLLGSHREDRVLVFTDDNAAVYEVSRRFLVPAITHQTPVKERHAILERFRSGEYPVVCASRVLNEGVDVPEANVAVVLSGTGSTREHIQRLGRVLRPRPGKRAVLYEVVSSDTVEEGIARRRRGEGEAAPRRRALAPVAADETPDWDDLGGS